VKNYAHLSILIVREDIPNDIINKNTKSMYENRIE